MLVKDIHSESTRVVGYQLLVYAPRVSKRLERILHQNACSECGPVSSAAQLQKTRDIITKVDNR